MEDCWKHTILKLSQMSWQIASHVKIDTVPNDRHLAPVGYREIDYGDVKLILKLLNVNYFTWLNHNAVVQLDGGAFYHLDLLKKKLIMFAIERLSRLLTNLFAVYV